MNTLSKAQQLQSSMKIPNCYMESHFKDLKGVEKEIEQAQMLVDMHSWILFTGKVGTGKTHIAVCLMRRWFVKNKDLCANKKPLFISVPDLILEIKASWSNKDTVTTEKDFVDRYSKVPFLVIDDLGIGTWNDWSRGIMYAIINRRYCDMLPTIITTNLSPDDLANTIDDRIVSRIAERGEFITLGEKDRRIYTPKQQ